MSVAGTNAIAPLNMPGSNPTGPCLGPARPGNDAELSEKYSALTGTLFELCDKEELVEAFGAVATSSSYKTRENNNN